MRKILLFGLLACSCSSCSIAVHCDSYDSNDCRSVLFIGNSYTFQNDLPEMLSRLAPSGGHALETGMAAKGGWSLEEHTTDDDTLDALQSKQWNYVVLQEQSWIPASESSRTETMIPAIVQLVNRIRGNNGIPILFETWGYRDGMKGSGNDDYFSMQQRVITSYEVVAVSYRIVLAPVGSAWQNVRWNHPDIDLWQSDGSHPSRSGTYLAACVFYAVIYGESPEGLSYTAGIPADTAAVLQQAAKTSVLG
jgi:hypothetical protein